MMFVMFGSKLLCDSRYLAGRAA